MYVLTIVDILVKIPLIYGHLFLDKNPCDPNPCHNGGACSQQGEHYKCTCRRGYTGEQCKSKTMCVIEQDTFLSQCLFLTSIGDNHALMGNLATSTFLVNDGQSKCYNKEGRRKLIIYMKKLLDFDCTKKV